MGSRLFNCEGWKTLHELGANLRKICNLCKDIGELVQFMALQGEIRLIAL